MRLAARNQLAAMGMAIAVLVAATSARAADLESVEALVRQGVELRQQRHDARALPLFQKAYGMSRTPRTAGQLGLCEMALGYWLDAENHLSEALAVPDSPWVSRNLADLTGALAGVRANISEVTITGEPKDAEVLVNGQSIGRLPLAAPVRLGKGAADVELRAPGYSNGARALKVPGGTQETVNVILVKSADAATVGGASEPATPLPPPTGPPTDQPEASTSNPRRIAAWTTGGVAALGLIFGVVETVAWVGKEHDFESHTGPLPADPTVMGHNCGAKEANFGGPGCQGLHDNLARARTLTFVGYGVAVALGVTSAILFANSSSDRSRKDTALACAPDVFSHGVGCTLSF